MPDGNRERIAVNRDRQCALYGAPLGDRVRRLTAVLGITQARLARTLGLSPAMLSQLVSAHRVKIGDPSVLARLLLLDQRTRLLPEKPAVPEIDALLAEVAKANWRWARPEQPPGSRGSVAGPERPPGSRGSVAGPTEVPPHGANRSRPECRTPADALRGIAEPARLAAAAAALGPAFPELAEVLRLAAGRPRRVRTD